MAAPYGNYSRRLLFLSFIVKTDDEQEEIHDENETRSFLIGLRELELSTNQGTTKTYHVANAVKLDRPL